MKLALFAGSTETGKKRMVSNKNDKFTKDTGFPIGHVEPIEGKEDKYESPENVIRTDSQARVIFKAMARAHYPRAQRAARIEGLADMNAPWRDCDLHKAGQGYRYNVNWGNYTGKEQRIKQSYNSLIYDTELLAEISTNFGGDETGSLHQRWGRIVSEKFTELLRDCWRGFQTTIDCHLEELVRFGANTLFWKDELDWRPEASKYYYVYYTSDASSNTEDITRVAIKHEMTVYELWDIYNSGKSEKLGWNIEYLGRLLWELADSDERGDEYSVSNLEYLQEKIRQGNISCDELYNENIELVSIYQEEYDHKGKGKGISRIIIHPKNSSPNNEPLFFKDRQYDSMCDVILFSYLLPGEKKVYDAKGFGHLAFNTMDAINKLKNDVATNARIAGTTFFRSDSGNLNDIRQIKLPIGGIGIIPDTIRFEHTHTNTNVNHGIQVAEYLEQTLERDNILLSNSFDPGTTKAVGVAQQQLAIGAQIEKNNLQHYLHTTLDSLYRRMFSKLLQSKKGYPGYREAKWFKEECIKAGVPEELFSFSKSDKKEGLKPYPEHFSIRATRANSNGSTVGNQLKIDGFTPFAGILGQRGRRAWEEIVVTTKLGHEYLPILLPEEDRTQQATIDHIVSALAANQLANGEQLPFTPDIDPGIMLSVVINKAAEVFQRYQEASQQGIEFIEGKDVLLETNKAMQSLLRYAGQAIIEVEKNPTYAPLLAEFMPIFGELENQSRAIANNAFAREKGQQNAVTEQDQQLQIGMRKIELEEQTERRKDELEHIRKLEGAGRSFDLDRFKAITQADIRRTEAEEKLRIQAQKNISKN